jgi:hypothetical protein
VGGTGEEHSGQIEQRNGKSGEHEEGGDLAPPDFFLQDCFL